VEWEISWGGDPEDVSVTLRSVVTLDALEGFTEALLGDTRFRPDLRILIDSRLADWDRFTTGDLRARGEGLARNATRIGAQRLAVVVATSTEYGLGRMMDAYGMDQTSLSYRRFIGDIDAARAWLREPISN
jgi:hypothetical protein